MRSTGSTAVPRGGPLRGGPLRAVRRWRSRPLSPAVALAQFTLAGVTALVVLSLLGIAMIHQGSTRTAIVDAREIAVAEARIVVQPTLTDGLVRGDAVSFAHFDSVVREQLLVGRLARVKLWTGTGRIVYSDDPRQVGRVFRLEADDQAVLHTGLAHANLSDLTDAENALERVTDHRLLQVYVRVRAPSGALLLFEEYLRFDPRLLSSAAIARSVAPAFLLGLLLLEVLQVPMAWRLVRRVTRGQQERDALHLRAAHASDQERRRIARDLHDGVVQSLAGVSYTLAAVTEHLRPVAPPEVVEQIRAATRATRRGVAELRTLITDIHPAALDRIGLQGALADLLLDVQRLGITTQLELPAEPRTSPETTAAVYRAAQEAIRNITAHSRATSVAVAVDMDGGCIRLCVRDNGIGFDPRERPPTDRPHLGLLLLDGLARDRGGHLTVTSSPQAGTTLLFEVPR